MCSRTNLIVGEILDGFEKVNFSDRSIDIDIRCWISIGELCRSRWTRYSFY